MYILRHLYHPGRLQISKYICDFEVQNDYLPKNPAYHIVKRGIYYAAREISSQLGELTEKTNYDSIEKVYSIWVCNENILRDLQNTVSIYSLQKTDLIGKAAESTALYDLINVIIIRIGSKTSEAIFDYLENIFEGDLDGIEKYVDISSYPEIEKEVQCMTGLGDSIYERGIASGKQNVVLAMLKDRVDYETISRYTQLPIDEIKKIESHELLPAH